MVPTYLWEQEVTKEKCMCKKISFVTTLILLTQASLAFAKSEITRVDEELIFESHRARLEPMPKAIIPGLSLMTKTIHEIPLAAQWQGMLNLASTPDEVSSGRRKYFKIRSSDLDKKKRNAMIQIYRELLAGQVLPERLVLYAYTRGKETYLLPEFFKLSEIGQAAILFHETLWVIDPRLTYDFVASAEIKFQRYVETSGGDHGYDSDLFQVLSKIFPDPTIILHAAARADFKAGRLKPFLDSGERLPLHVIRGRDLILPVEQHLWLMTRKHPHVLIFKELYAKQWDFPFYWPVYDRIEEYSWYRDRFGRTPEMDLAAKNYNRVLPRFYDGTVDFRKSPVVRVIPYTMAYLFPVKFDEDISPGEVFLEFTR